MYVLWCTLGTRGAGRAFGAGLALSSTNLSPVHSVCATASEAAPASNATAIVRVFKAVMFVLPNASAYVQRKRGCGRTVPARLAQMSKILVGNINQYEIIS